MTAIVKIKDFAAKHRYLTLFCVIFAALLLRVSYFGFEYFPQLDDHIQYYNFPRSPDYIQLLVNQGLLASRPLAAITDLYIWCQMPIYLSVVLINLLYAASALLFLRVFEKHFGSGTFFAILYTLLPLGYEGTYWISASGRVVPGLFFTSLALFVFDKLCDTKKPILLLPFLLSALLSYGYYEQMLVLSVTLVMLLAILRFAKKEKIALTSLMIVIPLAVYFLFTRHFASESSVIAQRMQLVLPINAYYFDAFLPEILKQFGEAFVGGGITTLARGLGRGLTLVFNEGIASALFIPIVSATVFFAAAVNFGKNRDGGDISLKKRIAGDALLIVFALLAAIAPITPFLVIANPWFSLRNTVASFVGLALIGDLVIRRLFALVKSNRARKCTTAAFAAVCTLVCLLAGVSELHDYKLTAEADRRIIDAVVAAKEEYDFTGSIGIFGLEPNMIGEQTYYYHDHVVSAATSEWSLYGALAHYTGGDQAYSPCPLSTTDTYFWVGWNRPIKEPSRFTSLFRYDSNSGSLVKLTLEQDELEYRVLNPDGSLWARIREEAPNGFIEIYE